MLILAHADVSHSKLVDEEPEVQNTGLKRRKITENSEISESSEPTPKRGKRNKKEKNRKAAIECRKKRKEYVHTLEDQVK